MNEENKIDVETLLDKMVSSNIDKTLLKESAEISATLSKYGMKDWFPLGKPNPEGTNSKFHIKPEDIGDFMGDIAKLKNSLVNLDVFPLGIKRPELYEINLRYNVNRKS